MCVVADVRARKLGASVNTTAYGGGLMEVVSYILYTIYYRDL